MRRQEHVVVVFGNNTTFCFDGFDNAAPAFLTLLFLLLFLLSYKLFKAHLQISTLFFQHMSLYIDMKMMQLEFSRQNMFWTSRQSCPTHDQERSE